MGIPIDGQYSDSHQADVTIMLLMLTSIMGYVPIHRMEISACSSIPLNLWIYRSFRKGLKKPASGRGGEAAAATSVSASGASDIPVLTAYTSLLRCLAVTEWLAGAIALLTRWVHSRGAQGGSGLNAPSRWGPILASGSGRKVLDRLMKLHRYILMEVGTERLPLEMALAPSWIVGIIAQYTPVVLSAFVRISPRVAWCMIP